MRCFRIRGGEGTLVRGVFQRMKSIRGSGNYVRGLYATVEVRVWMSGEETGTL